MTLDAKMWYLSIDVFKFYKLEVCALSSVIMFFDDPWHENWILAKFDKWEDWTCASTSVDVKLDF